MPDPPAWLTRCGHPARRREDLPIWPADGILELVEYILPPRWQRGFRGRLPPLGRTCIFFIILVATVCSALSSYDANLELSIGGEMWEDCTGPDASAQVEQSLDSSSSFSLVIFVSLPAAVLPWSHFSRLEIQTLCGGRGSFGLRQRSEQT